MRGSLLGRLLWRLSLVSAALVAVITLVVVFQFQSTVDTLRDRNLSGQAGDIARHLGLAEDGALQLDLPANLAAEYAGSEGNFIYQIVDRDGTVIMSSAPDEVPLHRHADRRPGIIEFFRVDRPVGDEIHPFYGASLSIDRADNSLLVQVAQGPLHSDALSDELLEELFEHGWWIVALVFLSVVGVIYVTVRTTLAPVEAAAREAAAIGPQSLDRRIAATGVPMEMRPLVEAFNNALDRIGESYRKQREFTANAAHELRTPIAVLRAHIDTLDDEGLKRELAADVGLLDRLVNQLLRLARADNLQLPADSRAELNTVALETSVLMGPLAIGMGKSIAVEEAPQPVAVFGDAGQIETALRNLVENALRVSPPGGTVTVAVERSGALAVSDDGPGVPEAMRGRIFERFWRGEQTGEGAGLGLSIVSRIVEAHGGSIEVADSPGGGAVFRLRSKPLTGC